jgi:hypothetical protein
MQAGISRVFLESGSSIAHFAEALSDRLEKDGVERYRRTLQIETNNILAYMEFVLTPALRVSLFPPEIPAKANKYGATVGPLEFVKPPRGEAHPIEGEARAMVDFIRAHFVEHYRAHGIIFGATAGIELDRNSRGFGPHVGSYEQFLFKRALLESDCLQIIVLDEVKLPRAFLPERCYPICDETLPWEYVCRNKPLALACAFSDEQSAKVRIEELQLLGFDQIERERAMERPWCFIASNPAFRQVWAFGSSNAGDEFAPVTTDVSAALD